MVGIDMVGLLAPLVHGPDTTTTGRALEEETTFGWDKYGFTRDEHIVEAEYMLVFFILLVTTFIIQFYVGKVWHVSRYAILSDLCIAIYFAYLKWSFFPI